MRHLVRQMESKLGTIYGENFSCSPSRQNKPIQKAIKYNTFSFPLQIRTRDHTKKSQFIQQSE